MNNLQHRIPNAPLRVQGAFHEWLYSKGYRMKPKKNMVKFVHKQSFMRPLIVDRNNHANDEFHDFWIAFLLAWLKHGKPFIDRLWRGFERKHGVQGIFTGAA